MIDSPRVERRDRGPQAAPLLRGLGWFSAASKPLYFASRPETERRILQFLFGCLLSYECNCAFAVTAGHSRIEQTTKVR